MRAFRRIGFLLLLSVATVANANLVIEITQGRDDAMPVAVVPFALEGTSKMPEDVAQIISDDLQRSGLFKPIPRGDLLSRPTGKSDVIWRDLRVIKAEYAVAGRVESTGRDSYTVHYELLDVNSEASLLTSSFSFTTAQLRPTAHSIADEVFEQLTGIRGAFNTRILYVTVDRSDRRPYRLQYADADGHRVKTLVHSDEPIMSPSWSPDASKVAYVSFESDGLPKIYVHDVRTGDRRVVSDSPGINGAPSWSPDGKKLALTLSKDGAPELYTLDLINGQFKRETNSRFIETEPRWMADGQSLIYTSSRSGGPQIYQLNLRNGKSKRLSFNGPYNARPDITPDGRHLIYVHRQNGQFKIGVQDLVRDTFNVLTTSGMDESPSVAPNGTMVIYGTQQRGTGVLEAISIDGRVKMALPSAKGEVREPAWSPFL